MSVVSRQYEAPIVRVHGMRTNGRVLTTGRLAIERLRTNRRVFLPCPLPPGPTIAERGVGVAKQRLETNGRVVFTGCVIKHRLKTNRSVTASIQRARAATGVARERERAVGRVL